MRLLYLKQLKPYLLIGALMGILFGAVLRVSLSGYAFQEISWHNTIRATLGHPFAYYSPTALLVLVLLYECAYAGCGGFIGYLIFRLKHRHSGFTIFFTRTFKVGGTLLFFLLFYLFLRVDLVNPFDATITNALPHPSAKQFLASNFMQTLAHLFLPSLTAVPDRGFPQLQKTTPQTTNTSTNSPHTTSQTPIITEKQPILIALPTAIAQPLPVQRNNNTSPAQGGSLPSPNEIMGALNAFRQSNAVAPVRWDSSLASLAQSRADFYASRKSIDGGAGFRTFQSQNGPFALGFLNLGELSNYGVTQTAQGLIVNYFGNFPDTRVVETSGDWQYVGIGVNGTAVDIVFGSRKCAKVDRSNCY